MAEQNPSQSENMQTLAERMKAAAANAGQQQEITPPTPVEPAAIPHGHDPLTHEFKRDMADAPIIPTIRSDYPPSEASLKEQFPVPTEGPKPDLSIMPPSERTTSDDRRPLHKRPGVLLSAGLALTGAVAGSIFGLSRGGSHGHEALNDGVPTVTIANGPGNHTPTAANTAPSNNTPSTLPTTTQSTPEVSKTYTFEQMDKMSVDEFNKLPQPDRIAYSVKAEQTTLTGAQPDDDMITVMANLQQALIRCYGDPDPIKAVKCLSGAYYYTGAPGPETTGYNQAKTLIQQEPGRIYNSGYDPQSITPPQQGKDETGKPVTYRDVVYNFLETGHPSITRVARFFLVPFTQVDGSAGQVWLEAYSGPGDKAPASWNQ